MCELLRRLREQKAAVLGQTVAVLLGPQIQQCRRVNHTPHPTWTSAFRRDDAIPLKASKHLVSEANRDVSGRRQLLHSPVVIRAQKQCLDCNARLAGQSRPSRPRAPQLRRTLAL